MSLRIVYQDYTSSFIVILEKDKSANYIQQYPVVNYWIIFSFFSISNIYFVNINIYKTKYKLKI